MSETKITKETKQKIAVNYAVVKVSALKKKLIDSANKIIEETKAATLRINGTTLEELEKLINQVNRMKNKTIKNNFYSNSIYINKIGYMPLQVNSLMNDIPSSDGRCRFYFFGDLDLPRVLEFEQEIDTLSFNYKNFSKYDENYLYQDCTFEKIAKEFMSVKEKYEESFSNSYINCYELIRNIRTLERIEKKFPDVNKYLPEEIQVKQNSKSIIEGFSKL